MSLSIIVDIKDDEHFIATFSEFDNKLVDVLKTLPNRTFEKKISGWVFPIIDLFILKKIAKGEDVAVLVTEEANKKYLEFSEKMKALKEIADQKNTDYEIVGLKDDVVLRNFQKVGIEYLDTIQNGLMGYDMGLGKSLIGIAVISNAIKKYKSKKHLLIVPASVKDQWGYQLAKFSNYSYTIVNGKDREKQYRKNTDFIIVNYDLIYRDIDFIKDIEWDLVICDEIQRARNYKTDTFKALNQLNAKRRIGLTGTPIENDLMDLFTIMKFLNPKIFGTSAYSFIQRYCTLNYFGQIDHSRYKNLEEVSKKIQFSMIRRKKRDVLDELPEKTTNHFYITLSDLEMKHYKEIKNGILEDIRTGKIKNVTALSQVIYLRELCDCLNLVIEKDKIVSSKLNELKIILKDLPPESKILIFTQFERMAKILEKNIDMKSVHLHGGVKQGCRLGDETEKDILKKNKKLSQKELDIMVHESKSSLKCINCPYYNEDSACNTRKKVIARFENDKDTRVFISTNAGASGLDLQVASIIINYDLSFNPAVNEQRIARIDRMGQKAEKILVINLICSNTIEEKVLKILEKKQKIFDQVIDNMDETENQKLILNTNNIKDLL